MQSRRNRGSGGNREGGSFAESFHQQYFPVVMQCANWWNDTKSHLGEFLCKLSGGILEQDVRRDCSSSINEQL